MARWVDLPKWKCEDYLASSKWLIHYVTDDRDIGAYVTPLHLVLGDGHG